MRRRRLASCLAALALGTAAAGAWLWSCARDYGDLSKRPPAEVFGRVFGIAPPAGVTHLRAAGYCPFDGEAWLTFRAADPGALLRALQWNPVRPAVGPDPDTGTTMREWVESAMRYNPTSRPAQRHVAWELLGLTRKPEYYAFPSKYHGSGWSGWIVVDRPRRRFFVYAMLS